MGLAMGGRLRRVCADPEENMYPGSLIYAAYVHTHTHTHTPHTHTHTHTTQLTFGTPPPWQGATCRNILLSPSEPRPTPTYLLLDSKLTSLSSVWRRGKCLYLFFKYLGLAKDQHIFFLKSV